MQQIQNAKKWDIQKKGNKKFTLAEPAHNAVLSAFLVFFASFMQYDKNWQKMQHAKDLGKNATRQKNLKHTKTGNAKKLQTKYIMSEETDVQIWSLWQGWTRRGEGSGLENVSAEQALWPADTIPFMYVFLW